MRNISDKIVEKIKAHILYSATLFFENRAVYEKMWKNAVERGIPHITIWRMRIATHTHMLCSTLSSSATTLAARTRLNTYISCLVTSLFDGTPVFASNSLPLSLIISMYLPSGSGLCS
jgi:hypothetical protein